MARRAPHHAEWMRLPPAQRGAWIHLLAVHRKVTASLDDALDREHGLSLPEWDALVHVAPAEAAGLRMSDLAGLVLLSPSGLTRMMERLEKRGLVARRRGDADARETYVALTERGLDALAKAAPTHNDELRAHFLHALTSEETATLARLLEKVAQAPPRCARHPTG